MEVVHYTDTCLSQHAAVVVEIVKQKVFQYIFFFFLYMYYNYKTFHNK